EHERRGEPVRQNREDGAHAAPRSALSPYQECSDACVTDTFPSVSRYSSCESSRHESPGRRPAIQVGRSRPVASRNTSSESCCLGVDIGASVCSRVDDCTVAHRTGPCQEVYTCG